MSLNLGIDSGVEKRRKIPVKNKNNADRQRFQGGFVKTDPPFDYLAQWFSNPAKSAPDQPVFAGLWRQTCANPAQTVKLSLLLTAITEFNA